MDELLDDIYQGLLPHLQIESVNSHNPVVVLHVPHPWQIVGAGNYAAVFCHPDAPTWVVKVYAPKRPGFAEEVEVYRRLGSHPAFSECLYAGENFLVLKRLNGMTLYDCMHHGIRIPVKVIQDIDEALDYARSRGLFPHDVHGRNVMMWQGRGKVVDVSDFLHLEPCSAWDDLKRAYYWIYRPLFSWLPWRVPHCVLDTVRTSYRHYRRLVFRH
jgi:hypothetical protein